MSTYDRCYLKQTPISVQVTRHSLSSLKFTETYIHEITSVQLYKSYILLCVRKYLHAKQIRKKSLSGKHSIKRLIKTTEMLLAQFSKQASQNRIEHWFLSKSKKMSNISFTME